MVIQVVEFSSGGYKNQHTQRKLLNFENWCQKVSKFDFQSQFSMSKIIGIFLNLGAHFLLLTFFDNINFKAFYVLLK